MPVSLSRRQFLLSVLASASVGSSGCGTLLYPERRGQPDGCVDWGVVALDAVCLLFFFIPGVIAFAVDFSTGAIYLPPPTYVPAGPPVTQAPLRRLHVPPKRLTAAGIERAVSQAANRTVALRAGEYRTRRMRSIDEFWTTHNALVDG